jgi:predicted CopG family antitoxin
MRMSAEKYSSIRVKQSTLEQLKELGHKGESYDDVIIWLLKHSKKRKAGYTLKLEEKE